MTTTFDSMTLQQKMLWILASAAEAILMTLAAVSVLVQVAYSIPYELPKEPTKSTYLERCDPNIHDWRLPPCFRVPN